LIEHDRSIESQNPLKKQGMNSTGNKNRVELRLPKKGLWVCESMANFFYKNGYIPKPTLAEVARLAITILANKYMNQEDAITQELKVIIPVINYNKLELELTEMRAQLAAEKKINSQHEKKIESQRIEIETHTKNLDTVRNTLRKERQEKIEPD
jgi:hypothetical protein